MKNAIIVTLMLTTLSSFVAEVNHDRHEAASQKLARQLLRSFQQSSPESYARLLPSLNDFFIFMESNNAVYKDNIDAAKKTFAAEYGSKIVQQAKKYFEGMIENGDRMGIDWTKAKLLRWNLNDTPGNDNLYSFEISIDSQGKEFKIEVAKVFFINDQFRVSQFVRLL